MQVARKVDRVVAIRDGKTSSELLRRSVSPEAALESMHEPEVHEELAVLDQAGRLQIPQEYLQAIGVEDKLRIELEDGRILLVPPKLRV
jgi:hypothetical protein